jgi:hypothetical protein
MTSNQGLIDELSTYSRNGWLRAFRNGKQIYQRNSIYPR